MAPKYSVTYFDVKGLAEPIRYVLAYAGVEFEDKRLNYDSWNDVKSSMPFQKLPFLEEDGKVCNQSSAICRYLARKYGLMGNSEWEAMLVDAAVDTITDLRIDLGKYHFEQVEEAKAKHKESLEKEKLPYYLSTLEDMVKKNGGYLVGGKVTWADLHFASLNNLFSMLWDKKPITDNYPHLKALVDKVENLPKIKEWIDKRPVTEW
ncbi:glutathione S-transferase [Anabrus simplex]|uniref:glutathione S-transferase n=1 Tax=Anabrus simplex TaxID=316456 RepID=UPI0035A29E15